MSTNYDEIIDLIKEYDQLNDSLIEERSRQITQKYCDNLPVSNELILRSNVEKLFAKLLAHNRHIRQIIDNEELLKLYFYRFLVFDTDSVNEFGDSQQFIRLKRESISVMDQLFDIFKRLVSDNVYDSELIGVSTLNDRVSVISQTFSKEWMNCLAEIDVKFYELSQKSNKELKK